MSYECTRTPGKRHIRHLRANTQLVRVEAPLTSCLLEPPYALLPLVRVIWFDHSNAWRACAHIAINTVTHVCVFARVFFHFLHAPPIFLTAV